MFKLSKACSHLTTKINFCYMSVTHFKLEHKIEPGVNAEYPPCLYKSLKDNSSCRLNSVWRVPPTLERRQISSDVTNTSPFYSAGFVPGAPKSSGSLVAPEEAVNSHRQKYRGKKMPPLQLCHDLTLSSCIPSKKDSTRAELDPLSSFYVSPAGVVFESFCLLRFVRISVNPVHAPASPGSPETMPINAPILFPDLGSHKVSHSCTKAP